MKKLILVVEQNEPVGKMVVRVLESSGYDVALARSVREATARCESAQPAAMLLDLDLLGEEGIAKDDPISRVVPRLPVIGIGSSPRASEWHAGGWIRTCMEKPLDWPALLDTLQELLGEAALDEAPSADETS